MKIKNRVVQKLVHLSAMASAAVLLNLVDPSTATAATYYVSTTGNDANSCSAAQNTATAKRSISGNSGGLTCLLPGDTLFIRGGTYTEQITDLYVAFPGGTSWNSAVRVSAQPGETVTLNAQINLIRSTTRYQIWEGFVINAKGWENGIRIATGANHIRFQDIELLNASRSGILLPRQGDSYNEFIRMKVHHNGGHGFYISGGNNLIDGCEVYSNGGLTEQNGYGIQVYNGYTGERANANVVRNNRVHSHNIGSGGGIILSVGDGNLAYNNLVYRNVNGIFVGYSPTDTKVFNNVIYGNANDGLRVQHGTGGVVKNNIMYMNGVNYTALVSVAASNNLTSDPGFVNPGSSDFRVQSGSPAVDRGIPLAEVQSDMVGTPRPQGASFDIGAFELGSSTSLPQAPSNVRIISQ